MLSAFGDVKNRQEGVNRREVLRVGGLSLLGLPLPTLFKATEQSGRQAAVRRGTRAKSVILFNLLGGPSHRDMFDHPTM